MKNSIYLNSYVTQKNIKSDSIRTFSRLEGLDEAYVRSSIGKRRLLTRIWNAVIKELTMPEDGYEKYEPIRLGQRSTKPWNLAK